MQRSHSKIVRIWLNATPRFHVGANEFKSVGLFYVEYLVEYLQMGHVFTIINVNAPECLRNNVEMVRHI